MRRTSLTDLVLGLNVLVLAGVLVALVADRGTPAHAQPVPVDLASQQRLDMIGELEAMNRRLDDSMSQSRKLAEQHAKLQDTQIELLRALGGALSDSSVDQSERADTQHDEILVELVSMNDSLEAMVATLEESRAEAASRYEEAKDAVKHAKELQKYFESGRIAVRIHTEEE